MADISVDFWTWSSTAASNSPSGSTAIGTGLDDNLRALQAASKGALEPLSSVAGTNTITASSTNLTAYASGQRFCFIPANTNTGATTLNISSLGAKNVYAANAACVGGELVASIPVEVYYDGTQFQILSSRPQVDTAPIVIGSSDSTKKVRFEVDGLTTGTTRVITVSDQNFTIGKQPTRQILTSGSGTYTTPSGATRIYVRMCGGGGPGGPGGGAGAANGGAGADSTFGSLTAGGGSVGTQATGGAGGTSSGGDLNLAGGIGSGPQSPSGTTAGGMGGSNPFGGAGGGGPSAGGTGAANTGGGGGGGNGGAGTAGGGGGGAGAYLEKLITGPSATYSYSVGAGGTASTAGASGSAGGAGGSGIIIVDEYYN